MPKSIARRILLAGCCLFGVVAAQFFWVNPILEGSDNAQVHWAYIQWLVQKHQLPVNARSAYDGDVGREQQLQPYWLEGGEAPLYYILAAVISAPFPAGDLNEVAIPNPAHGALTTSSNQNAFMHRPFEGLPRGAELAIRIVELLGVVCGLVTVGSGVWLARIALPERRSTWLGVAVVISADAGFVYHSVGVSNDNLATALSSVSVLCLAVWLVRRQRQWEWPSAITISLAVLSKLNAAGLVVCFTYCVFTIEPAWRPRLRGLCKLAIAGAAIDGWWFVRNLLLYGDITGLDAIPRPGHIGTAPATPQVLRTFGESVLYIPKSLLLPNAVIGSSKLGPLLALVGVLSALGLIAGLVSVRACESLSLAKLLVLWPAVLAIEAIAFAYPMSGDGRFLMPAIAPLAIVEALGWDMLLRRLRLSRLGPVVAGGALAIPVFVAWKVVRPQFTYPQQLLQLPAGVNVTHAVFGGAELVGVGSPAGDQVEAGNSFNLTLYWTLADAVTRPLMTFVHVESNDPGYQPNANYDGPSGGGTYPPNFWSPGRFVVDRYTIRLAPDQRSDQRNSVVLHVRVGMYGLPNVLGGPIERLNSDPPEAAEDGFEVATLKIPGKQENPTSSPMGQFRGGLDLEAASAHRVGTGVDVSLLWRARQRPMADYTVFIQILSSHGEVLAQHDAMPLEGRYPTSEWSGGEQVADTVHLNVGQTVSASDRIIVGLYTWPDLERSLTASGQTFVVVPASL